MSPRCVADRAIERPEWTLTGRVVDWPDQQPAVLQQSAWTRTPEGWTCIVTVPRCAGDGIAFHSVHLFVAPEARPERCRTGAEHLLASCLRRVSSAPTTHLGDIRMDHVDDLLELE